MKPNRKSVLCSILSVGTAASALAQGTVIFENSDSSGNIYLSPNFYAQAGTYTVALLWAPGNALGLPQNAFTQIALYGLATGGRTFTGFFTDPNIVTTGTATAPGTVAVFEVQGWTGAYTSYAAAVAAGAFFGQSHEFLNATGNPNPPVTPPVRTTGWDGNLLLFSDPEPSSLAIAGLGAGVWLYFRRKKSTD